MNNLTLRQLRYFEALARFGHFGHAAADCAVTQPALSMQIRDLEATLGVALFERTARQVRLTGFGEVLLRQARDILRAVDEIETLARASRGQPSGVLRLGVIPTVAPYLLPAIIQCLASSFPELEPSPRETVTPRLLEELLDGRLDAAIVALPVSEPALTELPLLDEHFVLVRPARDAGRPVPPREHLAQMRLLLLEEGHCFRDQALSFCAAGPGRPREILDGSTLSTLVRMVGAGIGVTLIPEMAVRFETRSAEVTISRFPEPPPSRRIGMVWRRSSPLGPQLRQIGEVVRAAAEALAGDES
jgi:LysR family hydrogen peroxide-inducible transcriptional activator